MIITETKITRRALKDLVKEILREDFSEAIEKLRNENTITLGDLREAMGRMGCRLSEEETDFLYKLNGSVKKINPSCYTFADNESRPGQTSFVVDAEPLLLYFRIMNNGVQFDVEVMQMKNEFQASEVRADKRFPDLIKGISTTRGLTYAQLLDLLEKYIGQKPLLERFHKMKQVLNG